MQNDLFKEGKEGNEVTLCLPSLPQCKKGIIRGIAVREIMPIYIVELVDGTEHGDYSCITVPASYINEAWPENYV